MSAPEKPTTLDIRLANEDEEIEKLAWNVAYEEHREGCTCIEEDHSCPWCQRYQALKNGEWRDYVD